MLEFLTDLGPEARERPDPTMKGSMVAAAAVLAMVGLLAIAIDSNDSETNFVGIGLGLLALAAGHGALVALPANVRPAGVALIALGTATTVGFAFDNLDSAALPLFLLAAAYGIQRALGPARGASVLLTLGLLSTWAFMLDIAAGDGSSSGPLSFGDVSAPDSAFTNGDETVSYLSLILGIILLLGTRLLDGRGFHGTATSAVIVGDIAFVVGVFGVVAVFDDDALGSIIVIVAGLVLAFVGAGGERRFTTWLGGIGFLIGLLALLTTAVNLDEATQFGIAAVVVGAGIVLGVAFLAPPATAEPITAEPPAAAAAPTSAVAAPAVSEELPASPPVAEETEQGWHPDPAGRHGLRWHDGTAWTNHVADNGETSTDEGV